MALMSQMINMQALLAAQQAAIEAKVDAKTTETKSHITQRNNETKTLVSSENDATQQTLDNLAVVNGEIDSNVKAINAHTDSALAGLSGDLHYIGVENNFSYYGIPSEVTFSPTVNGGFEPALSRSGAGYITGLQKKSRQEVEVWLDGVKQTFGAIDSSSYSAVVGVSRSIRYLPYKKSIVVNAKSTLNESGDLAFQHVMTG